MQGYSNIRAELEAKRTEKIMTRWFAIVMFSMVAGFMLGHIIAFFTIL